MAENQSMLRVFFCAAPNDLRQARKLYRYLNRYNIKPWLGAEDLLPGQDWEVEMSKALRVSDIVIIFISDNLEKTSGQVQKEIKFAIDKALEMPEGRIFIIPIRLDQCEIPYALEKYYPLDLFGNQDYKKLMQILERCAVELGYSVKKPGNARGQRLSDVWLLQWQNRGFTKNPFRFLRAGEVDEQLSFGLFARWHVCPDPYGTVFNAITAINSQPMLIYGGSGSGKTFYCRLGSQHVLDSGNQAIIITNLVGQFGDLGQITELSLAKCVNEGINRYLNISIHTDSNNPSRVLSDCNEAIRKKMPGKKVYVFIDDVDQLFTSGDQSVLTNQQHLDAFVKFLLVLAQRAGNGDSLVFRIFIPDALKEPINKKVQSIMPEYAPKIEQYSLQWELSRCWDVVDQRLADAYDDRSRRRPAVLLNRLLTTDSMDRMRVYWEKNSLQVTPGCVLNTLARLTKYAFEHGAGIEPIKLEICDSFFEHLEKNPLCPLDFSYNFGEIARPTISVITPNPISHKSKIDFAILTIREDEFEAVLERFAPEPQYHLGSRRYVISRVELDEGSYSQVAIARTTDQGEGPAQDLARDMIEQLDPEWLLVVGIAGGVPDDDFTLGDVVVAKRLLDFSVKAVNEGKLPEYDVRGWAHPLVERICAALPAARKKFDGEWNSPQAIGVPRPGVQLDQDDKFYGDNAWVQKVKSSLAGHFKEPRPPRFTTAVMGATEELVKSPTLVQLWLQDARSMRAVEMELAGVYQAARRVERLYPVLAIRGISDIVGFKRDPGWTTYACHSASAFAYTLVRSGFIKPPRAHGQEIL